MQQTQDADLNLEGGGKPRKASGRKNSQGDEKTIKIKPIKDGVAECMTAFKKMQAATTRFNEVSKAVAERGGIEVATLKKLIRASAKGNFSDVKADIDQQALIFDEVGEIAGGKDSE